MTSLDPDPVCLRESPPPTAPPLSSPVECTDGVEEEGGGMPHASDENDELEGNLNFSVLDALTDLKSSALLLETAVPVDGSDSATSPDPLMADLHLDLDPDINSEPLPPFKSPQTGSFSPQPPLSLHQALNSQPPPNSQPPTSPPSGSVDPDLSIRPPSLSLSLKSPPPSPLHPLPPSPFPPPSAPSTQAPSHLQIPSQPPPSPKLLSPHQVPSPTPSAPPMARLLSQLRWRRRLHRLMGPRALLFRDKGSFFVGASLLWIASFWLGSCPETFYQFYGAAGLVLMAIRWTIYWRRRWHYYLFDFCYFANLVLVVHIWVFPRSSLLAKITFAFDTGPLTLAIVAFRNSLVFHDVDKVTSIFMHIVPAMASWAERWYLIPQSLSLSSLESKTGSNASSTDGMSHLDPGLDLGETLNIKGHASKEKEDAEGRETEWWIQGSDPETKVCREDNRVEMDTGWRARSIGRGAVEESEEDETEADKDRMVGVGERAERTRGENGRGKRGRGKGKGKKETKTMTAAILNFLQREIRQANKIVTFRRAKNKSNRTKTEREKGNGFGPNSGATAQDRVLWATGDWQSLFLAPILSYIFWAVSYYSKLFIFSARKIEQRGYTTLFTYVTSRKKGVFFSISRRIPPRWRPLIYLFLHLLFCIVSFVASMACWDRFWLHTLILIAVFSSSLWHGAGYYFEVFATRYQDRLTQCIQSLDDSSKSTTASPILDDPEKRLEDGN
uniref:Glycerophosphocholine acyltransferase 1 n=1 Tax=Polytomella parva TaxID=51329 RepID=A0A7S0YL22_9CHLO|mmetsp:Transcript_31588/g.57390  ORF Transcript_31588/g.57390 Transcript_31588/m.57390 type:complete len:728 (+) Transcript_31588:216-2399(+)